LAQGSAFPALLPSRPFQTSFAAAASLAETVSARGYAPITPQDVAGASTRVRFRLEHLPD